MDVDKMSEREFTGFVLDNAIHALRHVVPEGLPYLSDEDLTEYTKTLRQIREPKMIDDKTRKEAVDTLVEAMHDQNASWDVRVNAAKELLRRAFGQAPSSADTDK